MSNPLTIREARTFFNNVVLKDLPVPAKILYRKAQWQVLTGIPHLLAGDDSIHFARCECDKPDCSGITVTPGIVN